MCKQILVGIITVIMIALCCAGGQALALDTIIGVDYGPYRLPGQVPGSNIPDSQFITDLTQMSQKFECIKIYGSDPVLARIVPLISQNNINLKVAVGIYESGTDRTGTVAQINQAISLAQEYPDIVNMVVVGNECIAGEAPSTPTPVSLETLITDINTVKAALPDTVVTTCLTYQAGLDLNGPISSLLPVIDNVMVNIYPFYGGVSIDNALDNLVNAYNLFSGHGKPVWVGETGWPSAGDPINEAVPSLENEQAFISAVLGADLPFAGLYLFEAYDEPWKVGEGSIGPHWGLWDQNGNVKVSLPDVPHPVQLTDNNGAFDVAPQVLDDGSILWQGWDGQDYEIYYQEPGQDPVQLTDNDSPDVMPQMNALGDLVWMNWDGGDWEVWYDIGAGPIQLSSETNGFDVLPQITDDRFIYWQGWDGSDYEVACSNISAGTSDGITNNSLPDAAPQVNASGQLTWMQYDGHDWEIMVEGTQITANTGQDLEPQITPEGEVFWQGWDGSDYEVYRYTISTGLTENVTDNTVDDYTPAVNNGTLVWSQWDGQDSEILRLYFDAGFTTQISDDEYDDQRPRVNTTGKIVWQKWDGSDYEVYAYK